MGFHDAPTRLRQALQAKDSRGFGIVSTWLEGVAREAEVDVHQLTDEGYRKNSIASACIAMIATSAPEAPLKVYDAKSGAEVEGHRLTQLMQRPNPFMSGYELVEWIHTYLNTAGSCYLELVRGDQEEIEEVYPLRPDRMKIVPDADDYIGGYKYRVNDKDIDYAPNEILHVKFPDPLDEFYGLSPLGRVIRELRIDNAATDFTGTFFENFAVPPGYLSTEQIIEDEDAATRIRDMFWRFISGKNRGKPALLGRGAKYTQAALDFSQMEFDAVRSFTETRICAAFGVDPVLLPSWVGIRWGGKYSNYAEARKHLWEETIIPALRRVQASISAVFLTEDERERLVARYDLNEVAALQEDADKRSTRVVAQWNAGLITKNEARLDLGKDAVADGEKFKTDLMAEAAEAAGGPALPGGRPRPDDDGDDDNDDD